MKILFSIIWFILGLVQCSAIVNGFINRLGKFWGVIAAFIFGEIPILGTVMGILGASNNWGWSIFNGVLLFIGAPIVILFIFYIFNNKKAN